MGIFIYLRVYLNGSISATNQSCVPVVYYIASAVSEEMEIKKEGVKDGRE